MAGTDVVVPAPADDAERSAINVAILRALANIDPSARPILELVLRAVLSQLPSVTRSVDAGLR